MSDALLIHSNSSSDDLSQFISLHLFNPQKAIPSDSGCTTQLLSPTRVFSRSTSVDSRPTDSSSSLHPGRERTPRGPHVPYKERHESALKDTPGVCTRTKFCSMAPINVTNAEIAPGRSCVS